MAMKRMAFMLVFAFVVACGGGGGGGTQDPAPNPNPNPNPQPPPPPPPAAQVAPTVSAANLSTSNSDRDTGDITIQGGHSATLYLWYDWSDPNGDIGTAHIHYLTLDRDITADPPDDSPGKTSGTYIFTFNVPSTDGGGVTSIDFWTEDQAGHESNHKRVSYATTTPPPPPVPGSSARIAGQYNIVFSSEFGGSIRDRYDMVQVAGSDRISWTAHCDDVSNNINCFHMDDLSGVILDSTDQGHTFPFTMGDGVCEAIHGTITLHGDEIHISGDLDASADSFCGATSAAFPSGHLEGDRR
jgi:hypothetical protein